MPILNPDYYTTSIYTFDFAQLTERGIDTLLLDLDNTLLPRNAVEVPASLREWISTMRARGFQLCIVSNNWHAHVRDVAADLDLPVVGKSIKPVPFGFFKALSLLGSSRMRAAVVGDQMFTDVLGGRMIGAVTVMVTPLSTSDLPHTVALRALERRVLAGRQPLP